jgi:hypothetical protein
MAAARAAKVAKAAARKATEPDFDPSYGGNYGDASQMLERRRAGTQPNSRAKSAVERAEERLHANSPEVRRVTRKKAQMPGMDIGYNDDRAMEIERKTAAAFLADMAARAADDDGYDPDSLGEGEEIIETEAQRRARLAQRASARMSPVGRREADGSRIAPRIPARNEYGRIQAFNRAGKLISRTHNATSDKFDVPLHFIPDGWTYQWLSQETVGKANNNSHFFANGWEPVPAKRHDGVFTQKGYEGHIVVDGMMLVERPVQLTIEARLEELKRAKLQLKTQNEQFQPKLPGARSSRYRGTEMRVKRDLEEMPDEIRPRLVEDDGSMENVL